MRLRSFVRLLPTPPPSPSLRVRRNSMNTVCVWCGLVDKTYIIWERERRHQHHQQHQHKNDVPLTKTKVKYYMLVLLLSSSFSCLFACRCCCFVTHTLTRSLGLLLFVFTWKTQEDVVKTPLISQTQNVLYMYSHPCHTVKCERQNLNRNCIFEC